MLAHKFGRSTEYSAGRIHSTTLDIAVDIGANTYRFEDQIGVVGLDSGPFSDLGDSGSLVLERRTNKAVGLLFGGSHGTPVTESYSLVNHIQDGLGALGVKLA